MPDMQPLLIRTFPRPAQILGLNGHRDGTLPAPPWTMRMTWHHLLFAHWQVPVAAMRQAVASAAGWRSHGGASPEIVELDTFEGNAWIGIVPFHMSGVGIRGMPPIPGLHTFPELNVRTYVRVRTAGRWKPGVLFLSLDATSLAAIHVARMWFHLPYHFAAMHCAVAGNTISYRHQRRRGAASFTAEYAPCGEVFQAAPGSLEHWLTERYSLIAIDGKRCWLGEVHHGAWPLQPARAALSMRGLLPVAASATPDHLMFAQRVDALVWSPVQVA